MRIYKYEVHPNGNTEMPMNARILSAGEQSGRLFVWALVDDPALKTVWRHVVAVPTGRPAPSKAEFVGTVQMADGLVFHVFDGGER